jgi:thioredoxin reductase
MPYNKKKVANMPQNKMYDAIIVGASKEGVQAARKLAKSPRFKTVALISEDFSRLKKKPLEGVECVNQKATFIAYNRGLIAVTLEDGSLAISETVVMATGQTPNELVVGNREVKGVYYDVDSLPRLNKYSQALIVGHGEDAVEAALALSKKLRYVYLCDKAMQPGCDADLAAKMKAADNIVYLPNSCVTDCFVEGDSNETVVKFDTYDKIRCTVMLVFLGGRPNLVTSAHQLFNVDAGGAAQINDYCMTSFVPKLFAVGYCASGYTSAKGAKMLAYLTEGK